MEFTNIVRIAVISVLLIGNYAQFFRKEKYSNFEKHMFIIALSILGYNGAKAFFQF